MLFCNGVTAVIFVLESTVYDIMKHLKLQQDFRPLISILTCLTVYFLGLSMLTPGGLYFLRLIKAHGFRLDVFSGIFLGAIALIIYGSVIIVKFVCVMFFFTCLASNLMNNHKNNKKL